MAQKKRKRQVKRRKKKQITLKTLVIRVCALLILFIGATRVYNEIQLNSHDMSALNKTLLNLEMIIPYIDDLSSEHQLHWQEITALVAVNKFNEVSTISKQDIQKVASRFIKGNTVMSFADVVNGYGYTLKQKKLAYQYLTELNNYGYQPSSLQPDTKQMQFINKIKPYAIENYQAHGILPSITIAQAILESYWGDSKLAVEANNLFGIKASANWSGEVAVFETLEYYDSKITDGFRKYDSLLHSIKDHANFLISNPRYSQVFNQQTYLNQAFSLQDAGYSTATDELGNKIYATKLINLIQQYNLQLIDHDVRYR